ncbi:MAG: hypothetical protein D6714_06605 [Bacteroidetes bacterium]|nr:MAG: hypothetical protein D6714_06605 [Bacteroidota bacterium]
MLVSGPGIVGDPNIQNQKNISTLPDGTFIEINNVNSVQNWEYYRNNEDGPSVAYDGLTSDYLGAKKSLTARTAVEPCNTYHLKIAVADRSDFIYDSGVFLSEIKSGTPQFSVNYFSGIDYFVEDCTTVPDEIVISIAEPKQDTTTYTLIVGGTATPDVDYIAGLPSTITFLPGQTELVFPVTILADGITEGVETISLKLEKDFGCGSIDLSEITIELHDNLQVEILGNPNQDTIFICDGGLPLELSASGALQYFWSPPGLFDNPNIATPIATPTTSQWVEVLGVLGACQDRDSVYLQVTDPEVSIEVLNGSNPMCEGNTLTLRANNNVNNANLQWTPTDGIKTDPNLPIVGLSPEPGTTNYVATVSLNGCSASDTIEVVVDPFDFPQLTTTDTTICQNFSVTLADSIPGGTTTVYEWLPNMWIDDNTIPNATVTPDVPTTYTLIATSASGVCADTASVSINVLPSEVEIMNPDTVELCLGESVWLETLTSTNGVGLTWSPGTFLSNQSGDSILSTPTETIKYYANLVVGTCEVVDSVVVVVDSLPDLTISTDPAKESFCKGEMVTLLSPTYEPANFPNIDFLWDIGPGIITPDTFLNLVFIAQDTFIYVRETRNRGCSSLDSIEIIVIPTDVIDIVPKDTAVCPGFPVQLLATAPGTVTDIMWSGQGLSCNDCVDPVATIDSPGNYTISVEGEFEGCPVNNTATIEIWSPPSFSFPSNPNICFGESIDLNNPPDPSADYLWTLEDGTVVSTLPNPNVSPTTNTTYLVSATSQEGCVSSASINVGVFQDFNLSLNGDQTICLGDEITLTAVPDANDNLTYVWTANGVQSNFDTPSITVSPTEATVYTVVAEDKAGCGFTDSVTTTVNVNPIITTDSIQIFKGGELLSDTSNVYEGEIIDVVVFTTPPHDLLNNPTYEWFLDGAFLRVTSDNNSGEIIMPEVNGNQALSISVNVSDDNGCPFDPPSETILVLDDPVQIPNAFTPDGDEINNEFRLVIPDDLTPVIEEFKVFNRWGDMVYNNENGLLGWDGTYKGEPAPSDVYVYYIVYRLSEVAKKVTLKGEVTLLR